MSEIKPGFIDPSASSAQEKSDAVIIEAAHIYSYETTGLEHKIGAHLANTVSQLLWLKGLKAEDWLFVDDYNKQKPCCDRTIFQEEEKTEQILDVNTHIRIIKKFGFNPAKIVYEAALVASASELLKLLHAKDAVKENKTGWFTLKKGREVRLYHPDNDKYSCELLDACLYLDKLASAERCITILGQSSCHSYVNQQNQTFLILDKLGVDTKPISLVYFTIPTDSEDMSAISIDVCSHDVPYVQPLLELLKISVSLGADLVFSSRLERKVELYTHQTA